MGRPQQSFSRGNVAPMLGALGAVGVTVAVLTLRGFRPRRSELGTDRAAAWPTYLRDHLTGADAAIQIVKRLSDTHQATAEGALFSWLYERFCEDRAALEAYMNELGAPPRSIKRLAGRATGNAVRLLAGGDPGDLSLFRTLEALAIGVQGKRCLWRAAQAFGPPQRSGSRSFVDLEAEAVSQWEAIERCRHSLVARTFSI